MGRRTLPAENGKGHTPAEPAGSTVERRETALEKTDRNWNDLLQELRVLQTGIQILTGFLLTLPFQPRFQELTPVQVLVYLSLVLMSVLITALLMATVVMHRTFFQQRIKSELVRSSDVLLRITIVLVGLILVGTLGLIFDLVLGSGVGLIAAGTFTIVLVLLWAVLPRHIRTRALRRRNG
ncbi:DUF6328 family protein [Arthrobacter jiangjiafuii]|uniref:DUF6328 family protein n=1 Tax=Arthrobacter jiangjiafuii TaxID=2817475 RepID=UPI001F2A54B2|nr:DUF6328 family protein [Arthrobacter jiangjiafuii]